MKTYEVREDGKTISVHPTFREAFREAQDYSKQGKQVRIVRCQVTN